MKIILIFVISIFALSFAGKIDTLTVVNCKCDTIRIVKVTDTSVTIKLDTIKKLKIKK